MSTIEDCTLHVYIHSDTYSSGYFRYLLQYIPRFLNVYLKASRSSSVKFCGYLVMVDLNIMVRNPMSILDIIISGRNGSWKKNIYLKKKT